RQRHALAGELRQVVGFTEGERGEATAAAQGGQPEHGVLLGEVQIEQPHAVVKGMGAWGEASVLHPAVVQRAVDDGAAHSDSPNAAATRNALTTPSSWKPLPQ